MNNFGITDSKGFHLTFKNGWTISVQFGYGNYSDNYNGTGDHADMREVNRVCGERGSTTAEVAVWDRDKKWVEGHPLSRQTSDEVAALIAEYSAKP